MTQPTHPSSPPTAAVAWIIWFSIFAGLFIMTIIINGGVSFAKDSAEPSLWIILVPSAAAIASLVVRFFVIPKLPDLPTKFPAMIIGLALAEGVGILALFVVGKSYPQTQLSLLAISVFCILCHAPVYFAAGKPSTYLR
ncbi:MAG: hypothetical protein V4733_11350 [Verrucomicrobiota bacterium]